MHEAEHEPYLADLERESDAPGRRPGQTGSRFTLLALMALVFAVGVLATLAVSINRTNNGTKAVGPTSTRADGGAPDAPEAPDPADLPQPVGLGAPADGKASLMLPVRVGPDHDLVDGQKVTVIGSGFRPNTTVGAVMCTNKAQTEGIGACDMTLIGITAPVLADGSFRLTYTLRRFPLIGGQKFDCQHGNVDPARYETAARNGTLPNPPDPDAVSCIIAVGQIDNYDVSGGWPIAFAGATFLPADHVPGDGAGASTTTASTVTPPSGGPVVTDATSPTTAAAPSTAAPTTAAGAPVPGGTAASGRGRGS